MRKQIKAIEVRFLNTDQKLISDLFLSNVLDAKGRDELDKIKEMEKEINKDDLNYKTGKKNYKTFDF